MKKQKTVETIEDKLSLAIIDAASLTDITARIKAIQAIITTETTKALQELSNKSETHETPIYGVTNRQICEAIDALQKEQK